MTRWSRRGDEVIGADDRNSPVVRVPLREPVHVRPAADKLYQIIRTNCP
jgi:hypothetical protein